MNIDVGGAIIELPDGATPDAIKKAIEHFRTTPEFDKIVDKRRGAPARVRSMVGSAPMQDRLANLQRFYPDAAPYGDDNFVFSDPESGRPTLYNPTGLDFGDVASVGREISQFVGGGMGAVAGAPFGGPMGAAVGAGAGAAAGGALFDATMNLQGRVDTRSLGQVVLDAAVDFGANAVGQRVGELLGLGMKRVIGGGKAGAQAIVQRFQRLGIDPPAGAASGSRAVGQVEQMLGASPSGAAVMQEQAERVVGQITQAADDIASRFGQQQTAQGAGQTIRQAAVGAAERFGVRQEALYDEAFDLIGETTLAPVNAARSLLTQVRAELARAPQSLSRSLSPVVRQLEQIVDDAGVDGLEFGALRRVRTTIGREMSEPVLTQGGSATQEGLKRIYAALSDDLAAAATNASPKAASKLKHADRFTRAWAQNAAALMNKLDKFDADEKAFRFAMAASRDGGTALSKMRGYFNPEEWDTIAGTVLGRLGRATPGAQDAAGEVFSVNTFLTNWNRLAPEAKAALFSGKRYAGIAQSLDDLVQAASSLKGMEKLVNSSNTGHVLIGYATLSTTMAALGGLATGDVSGAAGAAAAGIIGPRAAAKLITSPKFVAWLVSPPRTGRGVAAHMTRLAAIAEAEPAIREEIYQYMEALRAPPPPVASAPAVPQAPSGAPIPGNVPVQVDEADMEAANDPVIRAFIAANADALQYASEMADALESGQATTLEDAYRLVRGGDG